MTATIDAPTDDELPPPAPDIRVVTLTKGRRRKNRIATYGMIGAFVIAAIPLLFVVFTVVKNGAAVISPGFLSRDIPTAASGTELAND